MRVDAPSVLMPEAAPHFYDLVEPSKNEIGLAWKVCNVESVAVAHPVNETAHNHLWLHTLAPNLAHVFTAAIRRNRVHS